MMIKACAPVAQLDRVSDSDSEGRRFDSCRAYHEKSLILQWVRGFLFYLHNGYHLRLVPVLVPGRSYFAIFRAVSRMLSSLLEASASRWSRWCAYISSVVDAREWPSLCWIVL